jgi:hypothetical protein
MVLGILVSKFECSSIPCRWDVDTEKHCSQADMCAP